MVILNRDIKCENCGGMALNAEEYEKVKGTRFDDIELRTGKFRCLYKCISCETITPGEWIQARRSK